VLDVLFHKNMCIPRNDDGCSTIITNVLTQGVFVVFEKLRKTKN